MKLLGTKDLECRKKRLVTGESSIEDLNLNENCVHADVQKGDMGDNVRMWQWPGNADWLEDEVSEVCGSQAPCIWK